MHRGCCRRSTDGAATGPASLFVGDLPPHFVSDDLLAVFSGFGGLVDARVVGGQPYGFVTFADEAGAQAALEAVQRQPPFVNGMQLRVDRARGSGDRRVRRRCPLWRWFRGEQLPALE
jgi:RNA recognition motif-containing protein